MISWVLNDRIASNVIKCLPVVLPYGFRIVQVLHVPPCIATWSFLGFPLQLCLLRVNFGTKDRYFVSALLNPYAESPKIFCFKIPRLAILHRFPQFFAVLSSRRFLELLFCRSRHFWFHLSSESFIRISEDT